MNVTFLSDLLGTIAERGRSFIERREPRSPGAQRAATVIDLSEQLLSRRGEAAGVALASEILSAFAGLTSGPRIAFYEALSHRFGSDKVKLDAALVAYQAAPGDVTAQGLHEAAEPRRQELFRRLNLAPGGTQSLVTLRADLLKAMAHRPDLAPVDRDLGHLFASWFNRGFLVVRRIDWTTPAHILEKIIRYEAVHAIRDWDDLRRRTEPSDRRCYAFFHPALIDEPLIFVEVALTREIPAAIAPLLAAERKALPAKDATTAVFYSISNCQEGLRGISFGNFLIKQVAEELKKDLPGLSTFVTLSPVPGFAAWLDRARAADGGGLSPEDRQALRLLDEEGWAQEPAKVEALRKPLLAAAAAYFLRAKTKGGKPLDPVARFHLGNGARLERLDHLGDLSPKGLKQSHGLMVNYLYDLAQVERNHETFADTGTVVASSAVQRLLRHDFPSQGLPSPALAD
ncbi:MAG TPA: malonyl-CoA decarboxylase [Beijerinckiaceae bacterium]|jgi:malonyl-CoA decarboxylase